MNLKLNELIFKCIDQDSGEVYLRILSDKEAKKWNDWMINLCQFGEIHNCNPKWDELKWNQKVLNTRQKKVLDKLVTIETKEETQSK